MEKAEKRVRQLKRRKYYIDKNVHGGETHEKIAEGVKRIKAFRKFFHSKHLEEFALDAGTLPSVLYLEYTRELTKGLTKLNDKQVKARAKRFGCGFKMLSDWQYRLKKDKEYINGVFRTALKRDELKSDLYDRMTKRIVPSRATMCRDLCEKHGISDRWFGLRFNEMFTDPHTRAFLNSKYKAQHEKKRPPIKMDLSKATKEKLFARLDEVDSLVGVYADNSKPKALSTLTKELRRAGEPTNFENMFRKTKRDDRRAGEGWRTFEDAVKEWEKSKKK